MKKTIDIKNLKTAKRYATALAQSATDCIDEVQSDLNLINDVIFSDDNFETFFLHPVISLKDKKETIKSTLSDKINQKTLNFLETLLDENRFNIFNTIFELFNREVDIIKNKQRVDILSAVVLDEEDKNKLKDKLSSKLNKEIILNFEENKDILGGLVVKLDDKIVDLSLKTKFEKLKKTN